MLEKKIFTFEDVTNLMVIVFSVPLQDRAAGAETIHGLYAMAYERHLPTLMLDS